MLQGYVAGDLPLSRGESQLASAVKGTGDAVLPKVLTL